MVQKYQSPVRVYKYPFELVMAAYERRFPTCPLIPVFVGCDVVKEETSEDGTEHVIERRCKLNVDAPYLLKKIIGVDFVYFIQTNILNKRKRCLQIEAFNESFSTRVAILEKCTYFVHPENPDWTCFEQSANLDIKSFFGFESAVERLAIKQYSQNIAKGKEIIEHFIKELEEDGITTVPSWKCNSTLTTELDKKSSSDSPERVQLGYITAGECEKQLDDLNLGASASNLTHCHSGGQPTLPGGESGSFQLETDYIQRYLGKLTVLQESKLVQLRDCMTDLQKGKIPTDPTLLRFLRAADFDMEKARENLCQSLQWRKKYQVDRILNEYVPSEVVKTYFPGGWHHEDKDGRPLYILRLGQMDVKGLVKSIGEDGLLTLTLHVCEEGLQLLEEATRNRGRPVSTWSLLLDVEGLNMRHLWRPGIKALLRVIEIVEANYPETMGQVFIVRAPRVFPILWTLVSPFIDVTTRSKFLFYGGNDCLAEGGLDQHIHQSVLPDFLGGTSRCSVVEGGLVPKSLYLCESEGDWERPLKEDSIYQCVSLSKGQAIHEVILESEEAGCVITWDFDVLKHDISFRVLYTTQKIKSNSASTTAGNSVMENCWQEGEDFCYVEPQIVCHDGESVQGSHVAAYAGCYILQWRYHCHPQRQHSLHHHQVEAPTAHIMYYTEFLSSAHYRGSLSSLQSGHSSQTNASSSCASR
ncbi:hypothetical protein B566_EDAN010176 [Ephemera danica]|nr:hypothetical protein B566_EDAN010176 [Ephemera danica]